MDGESSGGGVAGEDSRGSKKSSPLSSKRLREVGESSSSLQLESGKNTLVAFVCNKKFLHTVIFLRKAEIVAVKVLSIACSKID